MKVSPIRLSKEENGVDILSNGIWHETTLAEVSGDLSDRLFGEVDVPWLEEESDVAAFDNTRSGQLNRANTKVVVLLGWLYNELEKVRLDLVNAEQERKKSEQSRKLEEQARLLETILNDDFSQIMENLELARRLSSTQRSGVKEAATDGGEVLPGDGNMPSAFSQTARSHSTGPRGETPPPGGQEKRPGPTLQPGADLGAPKSSEGKGERRRRGLFTISFEHLTAENFRSKYDRTNRTIYINLDHPQVVTVLGACNGSLSSRDFLSMAYEIAGVEYAQAIQFERLEQGQQVDPEDTLYSIGETIDRISRKFALVLFSG